MGSTPSSCGSRQRRLQTKKPPESHCHVACKTPTSTPGGQPQLSHGAIQKWHKATLACNATYCLVALSGQADMLVGGVYSIHNKSQVPVQVYLRENSTTAAPGLANHSGCLPWLTKSLEGWLTDVRMYRSRPTARLIQNAAAV